MDTAQLKMVIEAVNSLGGSAQTAFYIWVVINNAASVLVWMVVIGGAVWIAKIIVGRLRESDDDMRVLRIIRERLEFSSYENASLIAHITDHVPKRKKWGET